MVKFLLKQRRKHYRDIEENFFDSREKYSSASLELDCMTWSFDHSMHAWETYIQPEQLHCLRLICQTSKISSMISRWAKMQPSIRWWEWRVCKKKIFPINFPFNLFKIYDEHINYFWTTHAIYRLCFCSFPRRALKNRNKYFLRLQTKLKVRMLKLWDDIFWKLISSLTKNMSIKSTVRKRDKIKSPNIRK